METAPVGPGYWLIMLNSPQFQGMDIIHNGPTTIVYRAIQKPGQTPVIVKTLRNPHPHFNELAQFRNQFVIARNLNSPYVVRPITLARHRNSYMLVMPDEGAVPLSQYWHKQFNPQSHPAWGSQSAIALTQRKYHQFLTVAIQLAAALDHLAQERIIHKDIKPANILIHPDTGHIQLIDFSTSSQLPKEQQQPVNPTNLEGTLAYIAPEQTGRMNRGIDYRTDFYSLGVTLYELLTGRLPFDTSNSLELLHCHIAQAPTAPADLKDEQGQPYPAMLSAIILKLMEKNAENRYQSALGLKHDLEECLQSLERSGEITAFELGTRDVCDRFLIPDKLYGREKEVQTLLNAFERVSQGTAELVLIAGFSGIGKTAIVNEVHKPITRQKGYFIKGKFDQFNRNIPFSAFVQAFRSLMGQLLGESDEALAEWKAYVLDAVGASGQVLIEVIPELEYIIGEQPPVPELSGSAAQNRFNLVFGEFIQVFATRHHPLVIFLDDLQWMDSASLNLFQRLMDDQSSYLLVLGAYRDNEVFSAHPLMLSLAELEKQEVTISTITLSPLSITDVNQLTAETLSCSVELAAPLTQLIYGKTKGNPFFVNQFLKGLYEDELITFERELNCWECDLGSVQEAALTDDVVSFLVERLHKLPDATQRVLKLSACIGNQFDLETLAIACDSAPHEMAMALWKALREGLVLPQSEAYKFFQDGTGGKDNTEEVAVTYRFLHDRVQQAAYSLIPDSDKQTTHYRIGQRLLQNTPPELREEQIFELVGQLNYGKALITEPAERDELARLNLIACGKAKSSTAYKAGWEYAQTGLSLLGHHPWQDQYEIVFALTELAAEFTALCGEWEEMDRLVGEVTQNSLSPVEQANVYRIQIQANISRYQPATAVTIALDFLRQLGVTFPANPTAVDTKNAIAHVQGLIGDRPIEDLLDLPEMEDAEKIAIVQIIEVTLAAAYITNLPIFSLIVCLAVSLCLQDGNTAPSSHVYADYGLMIAAGETSDIMGGVKFGKLALQLMDKLEVKKGRAAVLLVTSIFLFHRTSPIRDTLPLLKTSYISALEMGDYDMLGLAAHHFCSHSFLCANPLETLVEDISIYCRSVEQLKQFNAVNYIQIYWQATLNLLGQAENPTQLSGEALKQEEVLPQWQGVNDATALFLLYVYQLMLCYLFGDFESAFTNINMGRECIAGGLGTVNIPTFNFYTALSTLAVLPPNSEHTAEAFQQVDTELNSLKVWAQYAPMNHQHKVDLVEAEQYRVFGRKIEAIELYDKAIAGAKKNGYLQEEAIANERFAKFYLEWGREKEAALYMQEAYYCYARWGAKAKTDQLETNYPELLTPILNTQNISLDGLDNPTSSLSTHQSVSQTTNGVNLSQTLDFNSVLQAARELTSIIELEQLLENMTQIILTNAAAQKMALLTPSGEQWQVQAIAERVDQGKIVTRIQSQPLTGESSVPIHLIQYVKNTGQPVLISEASTDLSGILDSYLLERQPQSVLCLPLIHQGTLVAITYLEHPTTKGVFTPNRQSILELLCAQAAIALQNAQLYRKTQIALMDLQQAQLKLVQSEKMSTLGNLVAGVAHEINNPVAFLKGNIKPAEDYIQDLFTLITLYQQQLKSPNTDIEAEIQSIDLEFIQEDLPKLINTMHAGVDRICEISNSLRTFSRQDKDRKTAFNIQEGIDSTLLILKHRTKANGERPRIEIIKDYGDLPEVQCFPGQLNQVFMNVLANAIDACEEANQGKTYGDIEHNPNMINIRTRLLGDQVEIQIRDNGCGIEQEAVDHIFDQGFTTKVVGKGTGLGMAITRQIIEEKHGGVIVCCPNVAEGTTLTIKLPLT